jgi:5-methylcytosine-specific restriction endonuclease McrA
MSNKTRVRNSIVRPKKISISWELRKQKIVDDWKLGIVEGHTKYGSIRDPIRLYLLKLNNYCCCKCGFSGVNPVTNKTILQINHIDGNCMNSTKDNLEVICPNCHSMTPNYGSLNKNSARVWKRAKYNNPLK